MTDTPEAAPTPRVTPLTQFVRDLSFENILAQKGLASAPEPSVQVGVNLDAKKRATENQYEITIKTKVESTSKSSDDKLFILELDYCGIFQVENVPDDQLHPFLLIECPRILFPFLRRVVHDVTRDGGFPALNLENIDFVQLYRNEIERRQAEAAQAPQQ